jgi:hypothetical protein
MQCVHADAWVPGKTTSFQGFIGLMVVVCHLTGFVAIEPLSDMNSTTFARSVYRIMLRYGLAQMIITDPDSKLKGEFKTAFKTLKIDHHLSSKGNHNAVAVERFNRFLNAGLRVFNNDRDSNRVFVEGSETLTYAWNSCPVLGTDLSRSLLITGREFKFPIDFVSKKTVNFAASDNDKKSFASDLTTLLVKCREIYTLLIGEHRAAHREYHNAQLNNPKQFQLNDIVFTNVQVQSRKTTHTVKKLAYIRLGPYKIVRSYPSGSYELQLLSNANAATIKKHGLDLYLSPERLIPYPPTHSSDQLFADTNKSMGQHPYKLAGLDGYNPAQPWKEPTAQAQLRAIRNQPAPQFPALTELDQD